MKFARILSLVLVALLLATSLCACTLVDGFKSMFGIGSNDPAVVDDGVEENQQYLVVKGSVAQYVIVYDYKAGPQTKNAVLKMVEAFKTRLNCDIVAKECYSDLEESDDDVVEDNEILVGFTNRPESAELSTGMKVGDHDIDVINGKIVIAGGSDASIAKAVSSFMSGFIYEQGEQKADEKELILSLSVYKNVVVPEDTSDPKYAELSANSKYDVDHEDFTGTGVYSYKNATMGGARLDSYLLVYARDGVRSEEGLAFAKELQSYFYKEVGYELDVKKDVAVLRADYKIVIGDTLFSDEALSNKLADDEYYIALTAEEITLEDGTTAPGATLTILFGVDAYDAALAAFKRIMPSLSAPLNFNMNAGYVVTNMKAQ